MSVIEGNEALETGGKQDEKGAKMQGKAGGWDGVRGNTQLHASELSQGAADGGVPLLREAGEQERAPGGEEGAGEVLKEKETKGIKVLDTHKGERQ